MARYPVLLVLTRCSQLWKMLDYLRESAMLAARAGGVSIVLLLFFCLGAFLVFAGEGKR
jgi:hypothetical protein